MERGDGTLGTSQPHEGRGDGGTAVVRPGCILVNLESCLLTPQGTLYREGVAAMWPRVSLAPLGHTPRCG